jgi:hypothetical protein
MGDAGSVAGEAVGPGPSGPAPAGGPEPVDWSSNGSGRVGRRDPFWVLLALVLFVPVFAVGVLVATGELSIDSFSSESPSTDQRVAAPPTSSLLPSSPAASSPPAPSPLSVASLQAAAANTEAAQSAKFTMTMSFDTSGRDVEMRAAGAVAQDGKHAVIEIDIPGVGRIEERLIDESIYMSLDGFPIPAGQLPPGKHWVRISFGDLAQASGLDLNALREQAQSSTPTQGLAYLHGLSGAVERVGDDTVHGAHATHYRASIDYTHAVDEVPGLTAEARQRIATLGTVPADIWIDDHDRVVKMQFAVDGSAFGDGHAEMTMEISDFGSPVDIEPPPPEEVINISELLADGVPA